MGSESSSTKSKRLQIQNGMKRFEKNYYESNPTFTLQEETRIDLIETTINCNDVDNNITTFIQQFWKRYNSKICPKLSQIETFSKEYQPKKPHDQVNNKQCCCKTLLTIDLDQNNTNYKQTYHQTLETISKLLTGVRNKELYELLVTGYLRQSGLQPVLNQICQRYYGKPDELKNIMIQRFNQSWDKEQSFNETVKELHDLLDQVIKGDTHDFGWKCILIRGRIKTESINRLGLKLIVDDDNWYLWWFVSKGKTLHSSSCIVIKFCYKNSFKVQTFQRTFQGISLAVYR